MSFRYSHGIAGRYRCSNAAAMVNNWMFSWRKFIGGILFALTLGGASDLEAQIYQGRQLVDAKLIADTTTVVPGREFTAGLLLKMQPGWHTYWQFPGDAGIPTGIKWNLPPGWEAGPIQWPIPLKLDEPGDIQIYGYHDEVLLMVATIEQYLLANATRTLAVSEVLKSRFMSAYSVPSNQIIVVHNGVDTRATLLVEGELGPILRAASGSLLEQLGHIHIRRV